MKTAILSGALLVIASAVYAESLVVTLGLDNASITEAAQSMTQQAGVPVVVDSGLTTIVNAQLTGMELEKALEVLTSSAKLKWRKLYTAPTESGKIDAAVVRTQFAAVTALAQHPLVICDPEAKSQTVFVRVETEKLVEENPSVTFDPQKLGLKLVYFIYDPLKPKSATLTGGAEKPAVPKLQAPGETGLPAKYSSMRQQQDAMLMSMSRDERRSAVEQEMLYLSTLPKDERASVLRARSQAERSADPAIREQYRRALREVTGQNQRRTGPPATKPAQPSTPRR